jgi:regulation of enolase protein 1 (concanavalin A-like superfamily)
VEQAASIRIPGIALAFGWQTAPRAWNLAADGTLTIEAGSKTDLFTDPAGSPPTLNAALLLAAGVNDDFMLSARVTVDFASTYDAGVLALWADQANWAKLCFEYSPRAEPTIVSVVTRGLSDDCNSTIVGGNVAWLRISRIGQACAFHSSPDGEMWHLVRHFALATSESPQIGFQAQSPTGDGCTVRFDEIRFEARTLGDIRSGE